MIEMDTFVLGGLSIVPSSSRPELLADTFFFSSRRRHTILTCDWSSDVCSSDLCDADVDVGDGSIETDHGAGVSEEGRGDAGSGAPDPSTVAEDHEYQREEECKMYERRRRVPSEFKSPQEQHLDAFREAGVDIGGDARESVSALIFRDYAQMIGHTVGAGFGLERVDEIKNGECAEDDQEGPAPALGQRRILISGRPVSVGAQRIENDCKTENEEESFPGKVRGAQ